MYVRPHPGTAIYGSMGTGSGVVGLTVGMKGIGIGRERVVPGSEEAGRMAIADTGGTAGIGNRVRNR